MVGLDLSCHFMYTVQRELMHIVNSKTCVIALSLIASQKFEGDRKHLLHRANGMCNVSLVLHSPPLGIMNLVLANLLQIFL